MAITSRQRFFPTCYGVEELGEASGMTAALRDGPANREDAAGPDGPAQDADREDETGQDGSADDRPR